MSNLNGRRAILTEGFPGNETTERVKIVRYPSSDEDPRAFALVVRESGNIVTVHRSRIRLDLTADA